MTETPKRTLLSLLSRGISSDKVPYVVTVVVAALGFLVSQTMSRYDKLPIIEYSWRKGPALGDVESARVAASSPSGTTIFPRELPNSPDSGYVLTLLNISAATVIRCVGFHFPKLPVHFAPPPRVSNWTTSSSTSSIVRTSNSGDVDLVAFKVFDMQPGAEVEVRVNGTYIQGFGLIASSCSEADVPKGTSIGEVPIVKQVSFETVFIKHALSAFWIGLVAWVALLVVGVLERLRTHRDLEA